MSFLYPEYFWLLVFLLLIFVKKAPNEVRLSLYGYMITFIFIVIALSRPVIEQEPLKNKELLNDVIIAVDLSYSMQATDREPTRLARAKILLKELLKKSRHNRFGVIGFTTNAIILSPLSNDAELLVHLFEMLDEKLIMTKGSAIMPALKLARKMSHAKELSVVIFSDGGDKISYKEETLYAKEHALRVNVFMLASQSGSTIRLESGALLKDKNGDIVISRENKHIKLLSDTTGGIYTEDISQLLSALESQRSDAVESQAMLLQNIELFYYFVALAIVSFLLSVTKLKRGVLWLLLLVGISLEASVMEYIDAKVAQEAYKEGDYKQAIEYYKDIHTNQAYFNLANSYYKNGEYEQALLYYEKVKSSDIKFKAVVFYNMANTLVRLKEFQKAKESYLKSLTLLYTKEADENYHYIKDVLEQKTIQTGKQKTKKQLSNAKKHNSSKKQKEGGSSNMKVQAKAGSGSSQKGKKVDSEAMLNLNSAKAKLSSKQYELINKRGVDEQKPW